MYSNIISPSGFSNSIYRHEFYYGPKDRPDFYGVYSRPDSYGFYSGVLEKLSIYIKSRDDKYKVAAKNLLALILYCVRKEKSSFGVIDPSAGMYKKFIKIEIEKFYLLWYRHYSEPLMDKGCLDNHINDIIDNVTSEKYEGELKYTLSKMPSDICDDIEKRINGLELILEFDNFREEILKAIVQKIKSEGTLRLLAMISYCCGRSDFVSDESILYKDVEIRLLGEELNKFINLHMDNIVLIKFNCPQWRELTDKNINTFVDKVHYGRIAKDLLVTTAMRGASADVLTEIMNIKDNIPKELPFYYFRDLAFKQIISLIQSNKSVDTLAAEYLLIVLINNCIDSNENSGHLEHIKDQSKLLRYGLEKILPATKYKISINPDERESIIQYIQQQCHKDTLRYSLAHLCRSEDKFAKNGLNRNRLDKFNSIWSNAVLSKASAFNLQDFFMKIFDKLSERLLSKDIKKKLFREKLLMLIISCIKAGSRFRKDPNLPGKAAFDNFMKSYEHDSLFDKLCRLIKEENERFSSACYNKILLEYSLQAFIENLFYLTLDDIKLLMPEVHPSKWVWLEYKVNNYGELKTE